MSPALRAILATAFLCGCATAPPAEPGPEAPPAAAALPPMIQELLDALPHDAAVWQRYLSEEAVYVSETGEVASKAELLAEFRPFPPGLSGSIQVKNPRITEFGEVAIVVFDAEEQQRVFDQTIRVSYFCSHVWRREAGHWRLLSAHASVRARDPAALPINARRLKDYAGTYALSEQWRYRVEVRDGALAGGSPNGELRPLIAVGENVFAESGNPLGVLRIFVRGKSGKVERMVQRRKFADLEWRKLP